jgi:MPBQ/MSBQ methyltransferase
VTPPSPGAVAAYYTRAGLFDAILDGLARRGADLDALTLEDLAPVDEFHTAGRLTTLKALEMTPIVAGMHVLDAGSGLGGTARCLAKEYGCRVTGIDLTVPYVDVARRLTDLMGLAATCAFYVGNATEMPFSGASFDAAVSFHAAMNIADRTAFYDELARVLGPGAPLCCFDVMKGPTPGMRYPMPWADSAATSVLKSPDETRDALIAAGFVVTASASLRDAAIGGLRKALAKAAAADGPPPLGLHLLTGDTTPEKVANYAAALEDHQIDPVIVVATRV